MSPVPFNPNARLLEAAVAKLLPLLDRIAFVGGCATGLLITDPAAAPVRATQDVDVIVGVGSYVEFTLLEAELRRLGLRESRTEGVPICRWECDDLVIDVMPTDPSILGFGNRWFRAALLHAENTLISGRRVRVLTAPYFLATKLEAMHGRARDGYRVSHDLEDIVTVVDGRPTIVTEVRQAALDLQQHLSAEFQGLLGDSGFVDALPGHLLPDAASQQRLYIVVERIRRIALPGDNRDPA